MTRGKRLQSTATEAATPIMTMQKMIEMIRRVSFVDHIPLEETWGGGGLPWYCCGWIG